MRPGFCDMRRLCLIPDSAGRPMMITRDELLQWQRESIEQALDALYGETLAQWAGYATFDKN